MDSSSCTDEYMCYFTFCSHSKQVALLASTPLFLLHTSRVYTGYSFIRTDGYVNATHWLGSASHNEDMNSLQIFFNTKVCINVCITADFIVHVVVHYYYYGCCTGTCTSVVACVPWGKCHNIFCYIVHSTP